MATFRYKARDSRKSMMEGRLEAQSEQEGLVKLGRMGYFPVWIQREERFGGEQAGASSFRLFRRVRRQDITFFTRQLADLLDSGLTLMRALDVLREESENPVLQEIVADLASQVRSGKKFSDALGVYRRVFSPLYVSMVRSGEVGGMLGGVLARLADFAERDEELHVKVRSALAYPTLILLVGVGTIAVLLMFVIPKLIVLFEEVGQILPLPTRILMEVSQWFASYWWLILAVAVLGVLLVRRGAGSPGARLVIDRMKLHLPVWGSLIKKVEIARFAGSLSTLLRHGVPILQAMQVVVDATGNELFRRELRRIAEQLKGGAALSQGMRRGRVFPTLVTHMVAVGEEAGTLEGSLFRVADTYEREADRAMKLIASLVEPVMILIMGSVVGFIVMSMLLPIFQIDLLAR